MHRLYLAPVVALALATACSSASSTTGSTSTASTSSGAGGTALDPVVHITSPTPNQSFVAATDTITVAGTATDPVDGPLTSKTELIWTADESTDPVGESPTDTLLANRLTVGMHVIRLTATDKAGHVGKAEVPIVVK